MNHKTIMEMYEIRIGINDVRCILTNVYSLVAMSIIILVSVYIFHIHPSLDTHNIQTSIRSFLLLWGCINFFGTLWVCILLVVDKYLEMWFHWVTVIMRLGIIISTMLVLLLNNNGYFLIVGTIGLVLTLGVYIYFGRWFFFVGDAMAFYLSERSIYEERINWYSEELRKGAGNY